MDDPTTYRTQVSMREAIRTLQSHARRLELEHVRLLDAYGRTLAEDLVSQVDHPSCDNSALDGFACREADTLGATAESPVRLRVVGDIPAGSVFEGVVGKGEAVGIYTGAPVPEGADAIVPVEVTERDGDTVIIKRPGRRDDIRPRAQDLRAGEVYLKAGKRLTPAGVGVAASMGHAVLPVSRKPRVGILATGDEVIEPGESIRDGQVYNSNSYSVAGLVLEAGGEPVVLPRAIDDANELRTVLEGIGGVDLLVTSGGVSMGNYDFVRDLLINEGTVHFWKVAIRPGGPALFGEWHGTPVFGLPGNPVSSMVVFLLLVRAFLQTALGSSEPLPYERRVVATAASDFKGAGFKEAFRRGVLTHQSGKYMVSSTGDQSSGILTSMLFGNCLAVVPPHRDILQGEAIDVIALL